MSLYWFLVSCSFSGHSLIKYVRFWQLPPLTPLSLCCSMPLSRQPTMVKYGLLPFYACLLPSISLPLVCSSSTASTPGDLCTVMSRAFQASSGQISVVSSGFCPCLPFTCPPALSSFHHY